MDRLSAKNYTNYVVFVRTAVITKSIVILVNSLNGINLVIFIDFHFRKQGKLVNEVKHSEVCKLNSLLTIKSFTLMHSANYNFQLI